MNTTPQHHSSCFPCTLLFIVEACDHISAHTRAGLQPCTTATNKAFDFTSCHLQPSYIPLRASEVCLPASLSLSHSQWRKRTLWTPAAGTPPTAIKVDLLAERPVFIRARSPCSSCYQEHTHRRGEGTRVGFFLTSALVYSDKQANVNSLPYEVCHGLTGLYLPNNDVSFLCCDS